MKTWSTDFLQSKYEIKELVLCLSEICRSFLAMMHTLGRDRQICSDLTVLILLPWLLDVAMHLTFLFLFIVLAMPLRSHLMLSTLPCFWDKITLCFILCLHVLPRGYMLLLHQIISYANADTTPCPCKNPRIMPSVIIMSTHLTHYYIPLHSHRNTLLHLTMHNDKINVWWNVHF